MFLFGSYRQTLKITIRHAKTSLFDDCAGGPQGVQNSLMDKIRAKYEQLDSGEFGSPGTPAFDAEACELANLLAQNCEPTLHKTETCQLQRNYTGPRFSSIEDAFGSKLQAGSLFRVWRMQLCSHRYVRITGLLSTQT